MNFSDQWRSLWPVSSVFPAPNLLSGPSSTATFGPLLFHPSSPPHPLLSSPSLSLHPPPPLPPSSLLSSLRSFFSSDAFLPSAAQNSLAAALLSDLPSPDPIPANSLHALPSRRDPSTLLLFFPSGDNASSVGYLSLSFRESAMLPAVGGVFNQSEGFKHPCHRILKMSVVPTSGSNSSSSSDVSSDSVVDGFLIAATMYSVNWFSVESRERPILVPLVKQGFKSCVVHCCCSPHFPEESAVLLETGELFWFNLDSRKGGSFRVTVAGEEVGGWLSCEFGGQPWSLFVACSSAVVLVDLRLKETEPKVLVRMEMLLPPIGVELREKSDRILAFCRARFNNFHMSVVTEHQLLLFDARQPQVPLLTWDHGLGHPGSVAMYRLSELRPSDEFKWASESGFVILVGSFWHDEFSLFCYGPREGGALGNSSLYAWELPSCLPLSGRLCGSGDNLVREMFYKENLPGVLGWQPSKDVVAGFWLVPNHLLKLEAETGGFAVIRLMLSGKLEMQKFNASWDLSSDKSSGEEGGGLLELRYSLDLCMGHEYQVSTRYSFLKFRYLIEYMNDNLSNALAMCGISQNGSNRNSSISDLWEIIGKKLRSSSLSVSDYINDATVPTSIFEIASRRVLNSLESNILPLCFSKYSDLCGGHKESSFSFLEVPSCLSHHRLPPFFLGKPLRRSEKWSKKALPGEALVGPVLPLPVILTIQEMGKNNNSSPSEVANDNLLTLQCKMVLENIFPEVSIADTDTFSEWKSSQKQQEEKPFFVYEPTFLLKSSNCKGTSGMETCSLKEEASQKDHILQPCILSTAALKDEKFTTFVCGIAETTSRPQRRGNQTSDNGVIGLEMFDMGPVRLGFDSSFTKFEPSEEKIYKSLKRQFSIWQESYKPYQEFCVSSKIPKLA